MSTSQLFSDIRNMFTTPPQQQPVSTSESQKGGVPSSRRRVSNLAKVSKKNLEVIKNMKMYNAAHRAHERPNIHLNNNDELSGMFNRMSIGYHPSRRVRLASPIVSRPTSPIAVRRASPVAVRVVRPVAPSRSRSSRRASTSRSSRRSSRSRTSRRRASALARIQNPDDLADMFSSMRIMPMRPRNVQRPRPERMEVEPSRRSRRVIKQPERLHYSRK